MLVGDLPIYEKLLRSIRDRRSQLEGLILRGPMADYTVFREHRARLNELDLMEQELKSLLDKMVQND